MQGAPVYKANNHPCEFMCLLAKDTTLFTSITIRAIEIFAKDCASGGQVFPFPLKMSGGERKVLLRNLTNLYKKALSL